MLNTSLVKNLHPNNAAYKVESVQFSSDGEAFLAYDGNNKQYTFTKYTIRKYETTIPTSITNILETVSPSGAIVIVGAIAWSKKNNRWEGCPIATPNTDLMVTNINQALRIWVNNQNGVDAYGGQKLIVFYIIV